jgi:hypothetical protein
MRLCSRLNLKVTVQFGGGKFKAVQHSDCCVVIVPAFTVRTVSKRAGKKYLQNFQFAEKKSVYKVGTMESVVVKETSDVNNKSSTFHLDNSKDALRSPQELNKPNPS